MYASNKNEEFFNSKRLTYYNEKFKVMKRQADVESAIFCVFFEMKRQPQILKLLDPKSLMWKKKSNGKSLWDWEFGML
jgi:hypothetical protein